MQTTEMNEIEEKNQQRKINETKSCFFEKVNTSQS